MYMLYHTYPSETEEKKRSESFAMIETDITHSMRRYHDDMWDFILYVCITSSTYVHISISYIYFHFNPPLTTHIHQAAL